PFDGVTDADGVHVEHLTVPAGASRMVAKLANTTASDLDMYIGVGDVDPNNLVCVSATGTANESCDFVPPVAGDYWVLVQDWQAGGTAQATATVSTQDGPPTGTVQFVVDSKVVATASLNAAGKATAALARLASGSHTVVARYLGNGTAPASDSNAVRLVVGAKV